MTVCQSLTRLATSLQVDPVMARALEVILILHMDHEQNASTSTVRVAGEHCFCFSALAACVHLELVCRPWALGCLLP